MITTLELSATTKPVQLLRKSIRETQPIYWRKLIEVGVPIEDANYLAWIIARYDMARKIPSNQDRQLICKYCRLVCRAGLWCSQLLLDVAAYKPTIPASA